MKNKPLELPLQQGLDSKNSIFECIHPKLLFQRTLSNKASPASFLPVLEHITVSFNTDEELYLTCINESCCKKCKFIKF